MNSVLEGIFRVLLFGKYFFGFFISGKVFFGSFTNTQLRRSLSVGLSSPSTGS